MKGNIEHPTANNCRREAGSTPRWITIGMVRWPWGVFEMCSGTPNGYYMVWRGRTHVFQAVQFRRAEHLLAAVEMRLHQARLQWVAMATETQFGLYGARALKVLVRRMEGRGFRRDASNNTRDACDPPGET